MQIKVIEIPEFDTTGVETMGNMFYHCIELTKLDLSKLDTSKVKTMANMFAQTDIREADISNF